MGTLENRTEQEDKESIRCRWCKKEILEEHFISPYGGHYCNKTCYDKHGEMGFD